MCICTMRCPARRRVRPHKPRRHSSAPGQACDHHSLALLWRAHDHTLMHVACSRRGYQLRLQSVVGIRIASPVRFSSVTAVTALATAYAMLFGLHGPRRSLPVARMPSPLRPLRRWPFQNMKRARQEFVQASRGQVARRLPSHERWERGVWVLSVQHQRTTRI